MQKSFMVMSRKKKIIDAALEASRSHGFNCITRKQVADGAGVPEALVSHHYGAMEDLRYAVVREAILRRDAQLVAQAIAVRHPAATGLDFALALKAACSLMGASNV